MTDQPDPTAENEARRLARALFAPPADDNNPAHHNDPTTHEANVDKQFARAFFSNDKEN